MNATPPRLGIPHRRSVRRAVRTRCHAVSDHGFELLGEQTLDLSPMGMLLACDAPAALGEPVYLSVRTPGPNPVWIDAEAEVSRILHGYRHADRGYCVGLRFTYLERFARDELLVRLAGLPPPIPQRRLKTARQRIGNEPPFQALGSVVPSPVMTVSRARNGVPAGVFASE